MAPLRDLDFGLSPLLAAQAQSMGARYNSAAPTTTGMQEVKTFESIYLSVLHSDSYFTGSVWKLQKAHRSVLYV